MYQLHDSFSKYRVEFKYVWMEWFLCAVAVDADGSPVTVSLSGDTRRNIIVWMDHRAVKQAEKINSSSSPVLQYCGGSLSPEMQPPKVLRQLVCLIMFQTVPIFIEIP